MYISFYRRGGGGGGAVVRAGNFHDSQSDGKTATDLQSSYVKAIVTGKSQNRKNITALRCHSNE